MNRPVLSVSASQASPAGVGTAGFAVVGVTFGMARFCYGLTLPDIRRDLGLSELVLGFIASASFAGYLAGLLLSGVLVANAGLGHRRRSAACALSSVVCWWRPPRQHPS